MVDRKLLILTYHFPPSAAGGAFRMLGFAEHLPQFGWQCVVVAPPRLPWEPTDEALLQRVPAGDGRLPHPLSDWLVLEAAAQDLPLGGMAAVRRGRLLPGDPGPSSRCRLDLGTAPCHPPARAPPQALDRSALGRRFPRSVGGR